jgi:hypothetical protein
MKTQRRMVEESIVGMGTPFDTYSYLFLSLSLLVIALLALAVCPRPLKAAVLLSGLFSVPSALASVGFVPSYWDPIRVAELWIGPEDALFSFSTGIIAFSMALWPIHKRVRIAFQPRSIFFRFVACYASGTVLDNFFLYVLHLGPMQSALLTIAAISLALAIICKPMIILSIYGAVAFTCFYTLCMKGIFSLFPGFLDQWNLPALCGVLALGVPLEEIAWSIACGAAWPMITGFILDLRIARELPQTVGTHYRRQILIGNDASMTGS